MVQQIEVFYDTDYGVDIETAVNEFLTILYKDKHIDNDSIKIKVGNDKIVVIYKKIIT